MSTPARLALLVALSLTATAQAEELGRLFFSPTERNQLEQQQAQQARKARPEADAESEGSGPSVITVNGLIQRNDGSRIVWINGKAQKLAPGGDPNKVPVTVPGKSKPVEAKVGQRVIVDNPIPVKTPTPNTKGTKKEEED